VLTILAVALSFSAARQVLSGALIGVYRHRELVPFYMAEGLINLGLSLYWIRSLGIDGVALGTTVPNLVTTLVVFPWMVKRMLGTRIPHLWMRFWIRPIASMLPFTAATVALERFWPAHHLVTYFAGVALVLPLAAAGAWFIGLTSAERQVYGARLGALRARLVARG